MSRFLFAIYVLSTIFCTRGLAQTNIKWNAWTNIELSQGQENSHYFYNQIHKDFREWRLGLSEVNLASQIQLSPILKINFRGRIKREREAEFGLLDLPLLNVQFLPKEKKWSLLLGRFITPFGSFSDLQHPTDRIFIREPLSHSYFTNISSKVGFAEQMGERRFRVGGDVEWGSQMLYYGSYTNGLRLNLEIVPEKFTYTLALTNASPNVLLSPFDFSNWGIVNRIMIRPSYFWRQQISLSYGTFLNENENEFIADENFSQLLLGTDFLLESGFWAFTGEVIHAQYAVPQFYPLEERYSPDRSNYSSTYAFLSAQYEFPFISGMYASVGYETLLFGTQMSSLAGNSWDDDVWRARLGVGYKVTNFLLIRLGYNIQQVNNPLDWKLNSFRSSLTIHY